jgi:hypothetical protein
MYRVACESNCGASPKKVCRNAAANNFVMSVFLSMSVRSFVRMKNSLPLNGFLILENFTYLTFLHFPILVKVMKLEQFT